MATRFVHEMRVAPGSSPRLDQRKADIRPRGLDKKKGLDRLAGRVESLGVQHARLAAEGTRAVLLILQGLDAAGKDASRSRHQRRPTSPTTTCGGSDAR